MHKHANKQDDYRIFVSKEKWVGGREPSLRSGQVRREGTRPVKNRGDEKCGRENSECEGKEVGEESASQAFKKTQRDGNVGMKGRKREKDQEMRLEMKPGAMLSQ